jgi:hypothetical protein
MRDMAGGLKYSGAAVLGIAMLLTVSAILAGNNLPGDYQPGPERFMPRLRVGLAVRATYENFS